MPVRWSITYQKSAQTVYPIVSSMLFSVKCARKRKRKGERVSAVPNGNIMETVLRSFHPPSTISLLFDRRNSESIGNIQHFNASHLHLMCAVPFHPFVDSYNNNNILYERQFRNVCKSYNIHYVIY